MEQITEVPIKPRIKHRTFYYDSALRWTGERSGFLTLRDKQALNISSPPEFQGESGLWTPEDMLVAAAETCTMLTFLSLAKRRNLKILRYSSTAEGVLEFVDGVYRFTKITIHPKIEVEDPFAIEEAEKAIHDSHRQCIISNSIRSDVIVDADVTISKEIALVEN
jgi:peroxiredoxin-like protein